MNCVGYTKFALAGFGWQSGLKLSVIGLSFVKIFFLARLLKPTDFGLFALVLITIGILEAFTESGINYTIIQSKHTIEEFVDTAWIVSIIRGTLIGIIMILSGRLLSQFYAEPALVGLTALAALIPLIKGFINPALVTFQKQLEFHKESLFHLSRHVVEATLAVGLALVWPSVTVLVVALIGAALFEVVVSFLIIRPRPRLGFNRERGREIWQNARGLTLQAALNYVVENVDDLLLGKILGTYQLGLYHNAYGLTHKLTYEPAKSANHGLFPIFTRLDNEKSRQRRAFYKSVLSLGFVLLLVASVLSFLAEPLVRLVLGEQWLAIVPIVPILAAAGLLQAFSSLSYNLLNANKQYALINVNLLVQVVLLVTLLVWLGSTYGLVGAAWAILLTRLLTAPVVLYMIRP